MTIGIYAVPNLGAPFLKRLRRVSHFSKSSIDRTSPFAKTIVPSQRLVEFKPDAVGTDLPYRLSDGAVQPFAAVQPLKLVEGSAQESVTATDKESQVSV